MTASDGPILVSDEIPGSAEEVRDELIRRGYDPIVIRASAVVDSSSALSIRVVDGFVKARVVTEGSERFIDFHDRLRVLLRRPRFSTGTFDRDPAVSDFVRGQYRSALRTLYSLPATWMNNYFDAARLESNKPLQQILARRVGLVTIPTLCTDDPKSFVEFALGLSVESVAVKACAPWSAAIEHSGGNSVGTYTRRLLVSDLDRFAGAVARAPVLVQPYVPKACEYRVTIVDTEIFACRIDSQSCPRTEIDWRHYDPEVTYSPAELPSSLESALREFMVLGGLRFAAIDVIRTPGDDFVFVEVNPSGQYGWIEHLTDLPITKAICDWISVGCKPQ